MPASTNTTDAVDTTGTAGTAGTDGPSRDLTLRPFSPFDYQRMVEIGNAIFPEYPRSVQEARHGDETWEHDRYFFQRLAAVSAGAVEGIGEVRHTASTFHPHKYELQLAVDPAHQRRGVGSALYDALLSLLRERGAILVRVRARESMAPSVQFLAKRGFHEVQRMWESRLDVASFDFGSFAGAEERAAGQGIEITTFGAEQGRVGDVAWKAYECFQACMRDVPSVDPVTPTSFESFVRRGMESPGFLPHGYFIAKDGERHVGLSALWKSEEAPDVVYQGLTGVLPEYRGKGIAMAMKLRGLRFLRAAGIREIRTWNDTTNRPMLRINEAMGFVKQPGWILFEKALSS
jgi:GNAT superfamily N-acetyltransferase